MNFVDDWLVELREVVLRKKMINVKEEQKTKRRNSKSAELWAFFTEEPNPWTKKEAVCKHCNKRHAYHKKWEQALTHVRK